MTTSRWRTAATCLGGTVVLLALAAGCGSEERVYHVSGTVTYGGKPIPAGVIYFDPDPTKGGTGSQGFATITDGKFNTAIDGIGIRGGAYDVRVMGFDGKAGDEAPMGAVLWAGEEHKEKRDLPGQDSELTIDVPSRKN